MTFIVGVKCSDGIILCTDSLEDDGITKKPVDKIRMMGTSEWGIAIAGAGGGRMIDKFCDEVKTRLHLGVFDRHRIERTIESVLAHFQSKYIKTDQDKFNVIVAVHGGTGFTRSLYEGAGHILSPIATDCQIGMGNELWRLISDTLYDPKNCVADNVRLAIFATKLAVEYSSGVDEPVQVVSFTFGDQFWKIHSRKEIEGIESELPLEGFKAALQAYWRLHNPPTRVEQVLKYKGVRTPGDELTLLDGVKLEELYTVAGRRRASKIFRRNTDKLQQRAIVEGKRYRAAHSGASPPSSHSGRT
jgi:20S proteasome alpha/beta subunit